MFPARVHATYVGTQREVPLAWAPSAVNVRGVHKQVLLASPLPAFQTNTIVSATIRDRVVLQRLAMF